MPLTKGNAIASIAFMLLIAPSAASGSEGGTFNDWAYSFNQAFVQGVVRPFMGGMRMLPEPVQVSLGNAFSNLSEPVSALSHLMVGDSAAATKTTARFAVNSTVGLLGLFDVATPMGLPLDKRPFSEGVCAIGLAARDSYLVVPVVGPSTAGIAGTAAFVMIGSTVALAYVSTELAIASVIADAAGGAAALENAASSADTVTDRNTDRRSFYGYLSKIGC